ncbi:hypothetical protein [Pendulispora albinea]|uniref:Uncharacterized protein n=1 Tax=Pendulispora albinea TaxID=2741071 RepID=A0ABZ2LNT4_9BACT
MSLVRPRSSLSELVLPVTLWSAGEDNDVLASSEAWRGKSTIAGAPPPDTTEWIRPHRIDVVGTRELRQLDPSRLGVKYFVTCRSSDEEDYRRVSCGLERRHHFAMGSMLLGDEVVAVALRPVGCLFELFPVLTRPKTPRHLPLGALRIATMHLLSASAKLDAEGASKSSEPRGDEPAETGGYLDWLWK